MNGASGLDASLSWRATLGRKFSLMALYRNPSWIRRHYRNRYKVFRLDWVAAVRNLGLADGLGASLLAVRRITGISRRELTSLRRDYLLSPLHAEFLSALADWKLGQLYDWEAQALYALLRASRPKTVIETGVCSGVSSYAILRALRDNGGGRLISIDMPDYEKVYLPALGLPPGALIPEGKQPGFTVPNALRAGWDLRLGLAQELLPLALREVRELDVFLHDSQHTYEHMWWEYETAWTHLRAGGLLLSDDVFQNRAFPDFAARVERKPISIWSMACLKK